jgi:hypothetical protein
MQASLNSQKRYHHTKNWIQIFISRYGEYLLLGLIVFLAFVIRYIGLKFSYPLLTHADEHAILNPVREMTENRTLNAGNLNRPDLFLIFTNFILLNVVSLIKFGNSIASMYQEHTLFFVHTARLITAMLGSAMPILAWKIGKEGKIDFSLPAAIFVAFFPPFVLHSHYVTPDVPITLFTLGIILFSLKYAKTGTMRFLYIATFLCALNTSEKYPGLISFALIASAIVCRMIATKKKPISTIIWPAVKKIFLFGLLYIFFLYLVAPILFIEFGRTFNAFMNEARPNHLGADGLGWFGNMTFYINEFRLAGNWILSMLLIPGLYFLVKKREPGLIFFSYGILYWVLLSVLALHWERWALPMHTAPLLFAAYGASAIKQLPLKPVRLWPILSLLIVLLGGLGLFLNSFSASIIMTYTDTRWAALLYCQQHDITKTNSLYEAYSPFTPALGKGDDFHEEYQDGIRSEYYILSSYMYSRFQNEPGKYPKQIENYESIRGENKLIAEISPTPDGLMPLKNQVDAISYYVQRFLGKGLPEKLSGPTIQIYQAVNSIH